MKRTPSPLLAITSAALLLASTAHGRTRPRYGDGVRAQTRASVSQYEGAPEVLSGTVFETLFDIDETGRLVPMLAATWLPLNENRRWEITLRDNIKLHDATALTPTLVAKSLAQAGVPGCKVLVAPAAVVLECENPQPNMPPLLAQSKYLIATASKDGQAVGTGPYKIEKRDSGGRFLLKINDDYWGTRPYLDTIELTTARNARDEITDFSLDRADIIDVPTDLLRRMQQERARVDVSRPSETIFLVINSQKPELRDLRLRQAISLAIDRSSIQSVIFQRQGEIAGSLLPNWLTGYAFLFPATQDVAKARQLRQEFGEAPTITIAYDASDPLDRLIAERVALNARDAGIAVSAVPNPNGADLRIQHLGLTSTDGAVALNNIVERLNLMPPASSPNLESLYNNERFALQTFSAIPLVHLPRITALKDRVRNWATGPNGNWSLTDVWVSQRSPNEARP
jgi:ABC-type transport system substrate-binding protein